VSSDPGDNRGRQARLGSEHRRHAERQCERERDGGDGDARDEVATWVATDSGDVGSGRQQAGEA